MSRVIDAIRKSYPSLANDQSFISATETSETQAMGELASHVVGLFEANDVDEIRFAFDLTEEMISLGSEFERHAAIVGFLESVQNVSSHRSIGAIAFEPYLGPLSKDAWAQLIDKWDGKSTLAEVVASETGAQLQPRWWQFWKKKPQTSPGELLARVENPELRKIIEQMTRE